MFCFWSSIVDTRDQCHQQDVCLWQWHNAKLGHILCTCMVIKMHQIWAEMCWWNRSWATRNMCVQKAAWTRVGEIDPGWELNYATNLCLSLKYFTSQNFVSWIGSLPSRTEHGDSGCNGVAKRRTGKELPKELPVTRRRHHEQLGRGRGGHNNVTGLG